jgi:glutaredoxin
MIIFRFFHSLLPARLAERRTSQKLQSTVVRKAVSVTLYGKPGCHLCDDARLILERINETITLEVDEVDIRSDPVLFRRFDIYIPVIEIDGEIVAQAPISKDKLHAVIRRRSLGIPS